MHAIVGEHDGENGDENQDGNGHGRQITNVEVVDARNTLREDTNTRKATGYESKYIESSDPEL